jgi:hypothetical protein
LRLQPTRRLKFTHKLIVKAPPKRVKAVNTAKKKKEEVAGGKKKR